MTRGENVRQQKFYGETKVNGKFFAGKLSFSPLLCSMRWPGCRSQSSRVTESERLIHNLCMLLYYFSTSFSLKFMIYKKIMPCWVQRIKLNMYIRTYDVRWKCEFRHASNHFAFRLTISSEYHWPVREYIRVHVRYVISTRRSCTLYIGNRNR